MVEYSLAASNARNRFKETLTVTPSLLMLVFSADPERNGCYRIQNVTPSSLVLDQRQWPYVHNFGRKTYLKVGQVLKEIIYIYLQICRSMSIDKIKSICIYPQRRTLLRSVTQYILTNYYYTAIFIMIGISFFCFFGLCLVLSEDLVQRSIACRSSKLAAQVFFSYCVVNYSKFKFPASC